MVNLLDTCHLSVIADISFADVMRYHVMSLMHDVEHSRCHGCCISKVNPVFIEQSLGAEERLWGSCLVFDSCTQNRIL